MADVCARCGLTRDPGARFCGGCGLAVVQAPPSPPPLPPSSPPIGRVRRFHARLAASPEDPLRSRQAVLVAVVGVLLFLIAFVFLTANSAEAHACITGGTSSYDLITGSNACDSAYDAWRSGERLMPFGVIGLLAAIVVAVGRRGALTVLHTVLGGGR